MSAKEMRLLRLPRDLNRFNRIDGGNRADGSKDRGCLGILEAPAERGIKKRRRRVRGNRETRKNDESAVNELWKRRGGGGDGAPLKVNTTHVSFSFRCFFSLI